MKLAMVLGAKLVGGYILRMPSNRLVHQTTLTKLERARKDSDEVS